MMESGGTSLLSKWNGLAPSPSYPSSLWSDTNQSQYFSNDGSHRSNSEPSSRSTYNNHMLYPSMANGSENRLDRTGYPSMNSSVNVGHNGHSTQPEWYGVQQSPLMPVAGQNMSSGPPTTQHQMTARSNYLTMRDAQNLQPAPAVGSVFNLQSLPSPPSTSSSSFAFRPHMPYQPNASPEYPCDRFATHNLKSQMPDNHLASSLQTTTSSDAENPYAYSHASSLSDCMSTNDEKLPGPYGESSYTGSSSTSPSINMNSQAPQSAYSLQSMPMNASASPKRIRRAPNPGRAWAEREANGVTISFLGKPWTEENGRYITGTITEPKPHKCPFVYSETGRICGRSFERSEHLKRHMGSHSDERPWPCPMPGCNKHIGRSDNAIDHIKTHMRPATKGKRNKHFALDDVIRYIRARYAPKLAEKMIRTITKWYADQDFEGKDDKQGRITLKPPTNRRKVVKA